MIRAIAAIDNKRGLADDNGIPWDLPADIMHERAETKGGNMLMGHNTYLEFTEAPSDRNWFVVTDGTEPLREGFEPVTDLQAFMDNPPKNLWVFGGAGVFAQTIGYIDELHITHIDADFHCTKFFPPFEDKYELIEESAPQHQNAITYKFCVYRKNNSFESVI